MEVDFCEHLINIGFINKESFSNIILDYHKNYSNNDFVTNMIKTLSSYISNLSNEEKNYMSTNLVGNYLNYINNKKLKSLKAIFSLYKGKILFQKLKYLYRWKINNINNNNSNGDDGVLNTIKTSRSNKNRFKRSNKRYNQNEINVSQDKMNSLPMKIDNTKNNKCLEKYKILFNNYDKKKKHKISYNESSIRKVESTKENSIKNSKKNNNELQTSLALKEQKELMECTFSPKINKYPRRIRSTGKTDKKYSTINNEQNNYHSNRGDLLEIFNKLHNDKIFYRDRIKKQEELMEKKFREENTFKPKLYNSCKKKYSKNNLDFNERQKNFLEQKEVNSGKIQKIMDDNFSRVCSFVPEVNIFIKKYKEFNENTFLRNPNSYSMQEFHSNPSPNIRTNKYSSPFNRLYEDSKNRTIRQDQRRKDYNNYLDEMANLTCKKDNSVDYNKINELYLNEQKRDIINKTKKKVEEEEGISFKPNIYINELGKNIYSDFYERNEKFLKDRQDFVDNSIKMQNRSLNKDKFSKEQKKEIVKNIVERLTKTKNK